MTTIVIVEDEGLIAFNLALVVQERTQAEVVTAASVAERSGGSMTRPPSPFST